MLESKRLVVTSSALTTGWINLRPCGQAFFPADAFAVSNGRFASPQRTLIRLKQICQRHDVERLAGASGIVGGSSISPPSTA
jgi:hypothetical protein